MINLYERDCFCTIPFLHPKFGKIIICEEELKEKYDKSKKTKKASLEKNYSNLYYDVSGNAVFFYQQLFANVWNRDRF